MSSYYYKLTKSEAQLLCKKVGVRLPVKKKGKSDKHGIYDVPRSYLNEPKSIWIQPCHYYCGVNNQLPYEIVHSTTESAFSRFMNTYKVPARVFTY